MVAVQQDLRHRLADSGYRWTDPARLHVTLSFLGEVAETELEALGHRASEIARAHSPFSLELGGLGAFPKIARPRVLWMGLKPVEGSEKQAGDVAALAADLSRLCGDFGNAEPPNEAKLHVTLARSKVNPTRADGARYREASVGLDMLQLGELSVTEFVLFSSNLAAAAPQYEPLRRFPL